MSSTRMKEGLAQMVIVRASIDVFTKPGYGQTSVDDLLKGAGIARPQRQVNENRGIDTQV